MKKLKNGFELPVLGFGTWTMGGKLEADTTHDAADIRAIRHALHAGITHIDTAELYGAGHAEELVGEALKTYDRKKYFITSKVSAVNLHYTDVLASCSDSLKRLQTDYIDLYLIHAPNDEVPIQETLKALDELKAKGLIKHIGVSNFTTRRLQEAQKYTKNPIVVNQVFYNLIYRQPERDGLLKYCQREDIMIVAFRPVERGVLTSSGNALMDEMCQKYNKKPSNIAINWLISRPNVVAITKMKDKKHLTENLDAAEWTMESQDIEKLTREYPDQKDTSDTPLR